MLVDRGSASHLVGGDKPFVSPREEVIGKFPPVNPPGIAIDPKRDDPADSIAMQRQIGSGWLTGTGGNWSHWLGHHRWAVTLTGGGPVFLRRFDGRWSDAVC